MAGDRRLSRPDASLPDWEMPDMAYRPIPIVWFTAALLGQFVALSAVFLLLVSKHGAFTIGMAALISAVIGAWTWERGMRDASVWWKAATVTVLVLQFLLICLGVSDRL